MDQHYSKDCLEQVNEQDTTERKQKLEDYKKLQSGQLRILKTKP